MSDFIAQRRKDAQEARKLADSFTITSAADFLDQVVEKLNSDSSDRFMLEQLANIIRNGNTQYAYDFCFEKDTCFRDMVPMPIWAFIGGKFLYE